MSTSGTAKVLYNSSFGLVTSFESICFGSARVAPFNRFSLYDINCTPHAAVNITLRQRVLRFQAHHPVNNTSAVRQLTSELAGVRLQKVVTSTPVLSAILAK